MKKVAVITAVYNGEKYLADCALSVAKSITNEEFTIEHVIINDASTDGTSQILAAIPYLNIKKLNLAQNKGPAGARNEAVKNTDADYLFCLDSDDVIFQNSLRCLFEYLERNKADWVYGDFLHGEENLSYILGQDYYGRDFSDPKELLTAIFSDEHFFQQNSMYQRSIFNEIQGFDETLKLAEDLDFFIRLLVAGHMAKYLPGPLYIHRMRENNWSTLEFNKHHLRHFDQMKEVFARYRKKLEMVLSPGQLEHVNKRLFTPG